jgi:hypothetical protein
MKLQSIISKSLFILLALGLFGCPNPWNGPDYSEGHLPDMPVNFSVINTEYDDYNSTLPQSGEYFPLCFSSNRESSGNDYNIVHKPLEITWNWDTEELYVGLQRYYPTYDALNISAHKAAKAANSTDNEFGPFMQLMGEHQDQNSEFGYYFAMTLLFSSDRNASGQDIYFVENDKQEAYNTAKPVHFLNSAYNDCYPSFNQNDSGIYFCSDRQGEYDVFFARVNLSSQDWPAIFGDTTAKPIRKVMELSSDSADKCPFILGNYMVFASNRAGGMGGYDLYYSKFENGSWTKPVNFGPKINTEYDEFRPVIRREEGFDNDFMIFSSNRPGGKGGFDLYYVGIEKIPY